GNRAVLLGGLDGRRRPVCPRPPAGPGGLAAESGVSWHGMAASSSCGLAHPGRRHPPLPFPGGIPVAGDQPRGTAHGDRVARGRRTVPTPGGPSRDGPCGRRRRAPTHATELPHHFRFPDTPGTHLDTHPPFRAISVGANRCQWVLGGRRWSAELPDLFSS